MMAVEHILQETTVVSLGGISVGIGNIYQDEYRLADGTRTCGLTTTLIPLGQPPDAELVVGPGSIVTFGASTYEVLDVSPGKGTNGAVAVRETSPSG
jgi:hypothetical protein